MKNAVYERCRFFLRNLSVITLGLAFSTATALIALRFAHLFRPDFIRWNLKSAVPLILVGVAFACLQFIMPRTRTQMLLGLMVSAAFILWGIEQYVSNPAMISLIDDFVVFFFVLDLCLVIYGHLKPKSPNAGDELPLDLPSE